MQNNLIYNNNLALKLIPSLIMDGPLSDNLHDRIHNP